MAAARAGGFGLVVGIDRADQRAALEQTAPIVDDVALLDLGLLRTDPYLAGVYNWLTSTVAGRQVEGEHLVNAPNWLLLELL